MSKQKIITISIISFIVILLTVLFGAVFRLRKQNVVLLSGSLKGVTTSEIISAGGLKYGKSIFFLDKEKAINKIEQKYPYVKVVNIKTKSLISVQIELRERVEMFYTLANGKYYVMDEELKILQEPTTELPNGLIEIKSGILNITNEKLCDFVGGEYNRSVLDNLYEAMYKTVKIKKVIDGQDKVVYVEREDIKNLLVNIDFKTDRTLKGEYKRLVLSTSYGVSIDIGIPEDDLERKVNICFATIDALTEPEKLSGTIRLFYDKDGNEKIEYFS